jgi:hypothetical protein
MTDVPEPEQPAAGSASHRDFPALAPKAGRAVDPVPWIPLSRAECLLLALCCIGRPAKDAKRRSHGRDGLQATR